MLFFSLAVSIAAGVQFGVLPAALSKTGDVAMVLNREGSGVPLALLAVSMLAALVPAWRATCVDPVVALRAE